MASIFRAVQKKHETYSRREQDTQEDLGMEYVKKTVDNFLKS